MGRQVWFALTDRYAGKEIFFEKGHRSSLQFHRTKHETLYVTSGTATIRALKAIVHEDAIECSGNPTALGNALDCVGRLGKVSIVGECPEAKTKPSEQYLRKRLTVLGSWAFNITEFEDAAKLVVEKDLNIEALATHRFSLKDASEAFKLFDEKKAIVVFTS